MTAETGQLSRPGKSIVITFSQTRIPLSEISECDESESEREGLSTPPSSVDNFSSSLAALQVSNRNLEMKMAKLRGSTAKLNCELSKLQRHIRAFYHDVLPTWQADILTRLIEVLYTVQHRNMPLEIPPGERRAVDRWTLTMSYSIAAERITQYELWRKLSLPLQYHRALQRYDEIVEFRSSNPFRSECPFAQWLVTEKENKHSMFIFWSRLFPVCYGRTVEESSGIIPMEKKV